MDILNLLEEKINGWLWKIINFLCALIPSPVKQLACYFARKKKHAITWVKISPWIVKRKFVRYQAALKAIIAEIDFKRALGTIEDKFKKNVGPKNILIQIKKSYLIVNHLIRRPFRDFSAEQKVTLTFFSICSFGAVAIIFFQTQRIYMEETKHLRVPASVEVFEYERPEYYKTEFKSVKISNVRIPVYYPEVNELQTVTIDFTITLNNRIGRIFIEKREFPLRDYLIQTLEPILAKYSLDEEGKSIIKDKITLEIQNFLNDHQIDSEVKDVNLIYILAN